MEKLQVLIHISKRFYCAACGHLWNVQKGERTNMTVKELIERLKEFPENMEVMDYCLMEIENIYEITWQHSNYPYNKPDKQIVVIE